MSNAWESRVVVLARWNVAVGLSLRPTLKGWASANLLSVLTLKDWMITKQPAEATDSTVDEVRQELDTYLQTG